MQHPGIRKVLLLLPQIPFNKQNRVALLSATTPAVAHIAGLTGSIATRDRRAASDGHAALCGSLRMRRGERVVHPGIIHRRPAFVRSAAVPVGTGITRGGSDGGTGGQITREMWAREGSRHSIGGADSGRRPPSPGEMRQAAAVFASTNQRRRRSFTSSGILAGLAQPRWQWRAEQEFSAGKGNLAPVKPATPKYYSGLYSN
ncbi:unnamed protein product, partial [Phaeothamnion confervicola]